MIHVLTASLRLLHPHPPVIYSPCVARVSVWETRQSGRPAWCPAAGPSSERSSPPRTHPEAVPSARRTSSPGPGSSRAPPSALPPQPSVSLLSSQPQSCERVERSDGALIIRTWSWRQSPVSSGRLRKDRATRERGGREVCRPLLSRCSRL